MSKNTRGRHKGMTYEQIYGLNTAMKMKKERSILRKGKNLEQLHGSIRAKEIKEKLSKWRQGKSYEEIMGRRLAEKKRKQHSTQLKKIAPQISAKLKEFYKTEEGLKARKKISEQMKIRAPTTIFPKQDTSIEIKVQNFLKLLGIPFFTHQYMKEIEHRYHCDIYIPSMNLVIETDGDYWHSYPTGLKIDHIRTQELIEKGFKILRLWENEIKSMDLSSFKKRLEGYE
ncbi:MAG: DUF559 domain-containing protein [Nanoarchaeota archaeon]